MSPTKAELEERLAETESRLADAEHALEGSPGTVTTAKAKPIKPQLPDKERAARYSARLLRDAKLREPKNAPTELEILRAEVAELKEGLKGKSAKASE